MAGDSAAGGPATMRVDKAISTLSPSKRFRPDEPDTSVLSIDFDDTGELAVVARNDDTLQIYNCREGKTVKELKSHKYGVHLARYTHQAQSILYASTRIDDMVRYLSAHDNSYIRYFKGHEAPVTAIEVSPSNDTFITCSLDDTVRIWSLASPSATGVLNLKGGQACAFDPSASVIAVASPVSQTVLLYDYRNYTKAPFATFDLQPAENRFFSASTSRRRGEPAENWTRLSFSNDGRSLLVTTAGAGHFVLDAFDGSLRAYLPKKGSESNRLLPSKTPSTASRSKLGPITGNRVNPYKASPLAQADACWSPDGRYVVGGFGLDPTPAAGSSSTSTPAGHPAPFTDGESGSAGSGTPFGSNGGLLVWDLYRTKSTNAAGSTHSAGGVGEYKGMEVMSSGGPVTPIELNGPGRAEVVGYNPRFNMVMSADKDLVMWIPDKDLV